MCVTVSTTNIKNGTFDFLVLLAVHFHNLIVWFISIELCVYKHHKIWSHRFRMHLWYHQIFMLVVTQRTSILSRKHGSFTTRQNNFIYNCQPFWS